MIRPVFAIIGGFAGNKAFDHYSGGKDEIDCALVSDLVACNGAYF